MAPQFGHGPDLLPDSVILNEFSKKNPDGNGVPQLSQNAGIEGMNSPYDTQRCKSPAAKSIARNERRFLSSECICLVMFLM